MRIWREKSDSRSDKDRRVVRRVSGVVTGGVVVGIKRTVGESIWGGRRVHSGSLAVRTAWITWNCNVGSW